MTVDERELLVLTGPGEQEVVAAQAPPDTDVPRMTHSTFEALHDPLTSLPNRVLLLDRKARRYLVTLKDGSTVNRGCVVQTHLFHDRVLSMDTVTLEAGATLGPNSVILPAATIGRHATVGPVSLVMRGEGVPSRTCWIGNPIGPWEAP